MSEKENSRPSETRRDTLKKVEEEIVKVLHEYTVTAEEADIMFRELKWKATF